MTPSSRLDAIDAARGLAALCVAVYHQGFGRALAQLTGFPQFAFVDWPGATLAVPLFFVISGFCIHLGWLSRPELDGFKRRFFLQRFFRIYPPWVFAVLLSALVLVWGGQSVELSLILSHMTLTNGFFHHERLNVALWSVSVEAFLYLLYPFWLRRRVGWGCTSAIALAAVVSGISCFVTGHFFPEATGRELWFFLNVWIGWIAGAVLAEYWHRDQGAIFYGPYWWLVGIASFVLFSALSLLGVLASDAQYLRLPLIISLCVWPLTLFFVIGRLIESHSSTILVRLLWNPLVKLGAFSYSLYLLHVPIQALRFPVHDALAGQSLLQYALFVAWFGLVVGFAWLAYRCIELPFIALGRSLIRRLYSARRASD